MTVQNLANAANSEKTTLYKELVLQVGEWPVGVQCQQNPLSRPPPVRSRERHQDAPELGHVYHITTTINVAGPSMASPDITRHHQTSPPPSTWQVLPWHHQTSPDTTTTKVPFGYWALVHARRLITKCDSVVVVPHGADGRGQRLVVELYRTARFGVDPTVPTGVDRIAAGLSYPVEGAPTQYHDAYQRAKRERCGLHAYGILDDDRVLPKALKGLLTGKGTPVVIHEDHRLNEVCSVLQDRMYLNEANILVLPSTIEGAGLALFLRPTPAGREDYTIPAGRRLCLYSDEIVGEEGEVTNTDYCLDKVEGARRITWNPLHPDGANLGRYINQGGLVE